MSVRSRESISPRQSSSSLILASINSDADPGFCGALFFTTSLSYHIGFQGRAGLWTPGSARMGEDDGLKGGEGMTKASALIAALAVTLACSTAAHGLRTPPVTKIRHF